MNNCIIIWTYLLPLARPSKELLNYLSVVVYFTPLCLIVLESFRSSAFKANFEMRAARSSLRELPVDGGVTCAACASILRRFLLITSFLVVLWAGSHATWPFVVCFVCVCCESVSVLNSVGKVPSASDKWAFCEVHLSIWRLLFCSLANRRL